MKSSDENNQQIHKKEDEVSAEKADVNAKSTPANDGFKTGDKSNGMTWQGPLDEQAFDDESLSKNDLEEEGN
ncbi:MAG TPA: hypothetical protein VGB63_17285 [Pedobacter sp.]|jgi:hypothetical protein